MNYRDTLLSINIDNAFENICKLKEINFNKKTKAVVKANAYGHGLVGFSYILEKYKMVDSFCVSNLDEALALRKKGLKLPILVLGAIDARHFEKALENDISITIFSKEIAYDVLEFNKNIKVQFKIDTAMNRIGFVDFNEFEEIYRQFEQSNIFVEGVFSHFCSAEEDIDISLEQIEKFKKFIEIMPKDIEIHIQNSAGSINHANLDFVNTIRLGIGMYGFNTSEYESEFSKLNLKQLITLKSRIIMVKDVPKNQTISYNRKYKTPENVKIATVPLGYADGYKLAYQDSFAYICEDEKIRKFPIRGKICMDQIMIEVDDAVRVGDYVTFLGEHQTISQFADKFNLSKYEILTSFSERLYKIYCYKGEVIYEDNQIFKV